MNNEVNTQITRKEALNIVNQVLQTVSATPATHAQIQVAFAILVSSVERLDKQDAETAGEDHQTNTKETPGK